MSPKDPSHESIKTVKDKDTMPRINAAEAGRKGGMVGGKSRSAAKLAACRRNGFQKMNSENEITIPVQESKTAPGAPPLLFVPRSESE
jgi:hypothetical protein